MAHDYDAMARLLREFTRLPHGKSINREELPTTMSLPPERVEEAVRGLQRREWAHVDARSVRLRGDGVEYAGKDAAQLLALDVAAWIGRAKPKAFDVPGGLPTELREDEELLELALRELDGARAVKTHSNQGRIDYATVEPGIRTFAFGSVPSLTAVQVQQHIGDVVGRDKIAHAGSGPIVTGDHNTVTINADAVESFRVFLDALRAQGDFNAAALDALRDVARPNVSSGEVVGAAVKAASAEPRIVDNLKEWALSEAGRLAGAVIVEGVSLFLKAKGWLPA